MSPQPYRSGLATGLGVVLSAALVLALADVVHTRGGALSVLGLWALVAVPMAITTGLVLGAGNAQWGDSWIRRFFKKLSEDDELDRSVASGVITAALLAGALAIATAIIALGLVGNVQRKNIGALMHGGVVVALLPVFGLLAIPLYRGVRFANKVAIQWFAIPAVLLIAVAYLKLGKVGAAGVAAILVVMRDQPIGKISRVVILLVVPPIAAVIVTWKLMSRIELDWEVLRLPTLIVPALLPFVAIAIGLVAYYPAATVREKIPRRDVIAAAGAVLALAIAVIGLRPSTQTAAHVSQNSYLAARLVPVLRKLIDRDHDGVSAFFGGPDCDDHNAAVRPGAEEIPGNKIDDNCVGGDGATDVVENPPGDAGVAVTIDAPPAAPAVSGGKNVLVIFVDTLRSDRLGIAGYQRDGKSLTPRLDAFAKDAVVFSNAYAQAPNTPRSVPSFLASRYPSQLKVDKKNRDYPTVDDANDLFFEAFKDSGFKTIGITSHFYFCDRKRDPNICPDVVKWMNSNVLQGATEWDNDGAQNIPESNKDIAGPRVVKKTIAKLEALAAKPDDKFAMLVHLFEPHSTYMTHEGFPINTQGDESLKQKYDYEIAVCDRFIGEILDGLAKTGLDKTTTVVIMSDHGEAFGVHKFAGGRMFFHGQTLYRELLHVPLMFRVPGVKGRTADDVVELIDLAPTLAALFGVKPPESWRGRSLAPAIAGDKLPEKAAFSELLPADAWNHDAKSMVTGDGSRHVFYRISDSTWEIYDLDADPEEKKNIADSDPNAKQLQQDVATWIEGPLAKGAK